jgi:hypothetical protein
VDRNGAKALIGPKKFPILIAKSLRPRQGGKSAISFQRSAINVEILDNKIIGLGMNTVSGYRLPVAGLKSSPSNDRGSEMNAALDFDFKPVADFLI